MLASFLPGFLLSSSLILAIGAQNAFVLRQGLRRQHVFWVCLICTLSDAILIAAGVAGFGTLASQSPLLGGAMLYGGAGFLFWYGLQSFRSAFAGGETLTAAQNASLSLKPTLATLLALTLLNPHVYLDTLLLIGSVSAQYPHRYAFGAGASIASGLFFFALGYGASLLAPVFARPRSWQVLDVIVGTTMWAIALKLLVL